MECIVYLHVETSTIYAYMEHQGYRASYSVALGSFKFDKMSEPDEDSILEWAIPRVKLLALDPKLKLRVVNYATHAYWPVTL